MGGRPPKLLNQKIGAYTKEDKEIYEKSLPVFETQNFVPPPTLSLKEKEVWDWLVSIFHGTVNCMVSDADVQLMELYCRAKVLTDEADAALKKDPRSYILVASGIDKYGKPKTTAKANPYIAQRRDNAALCLKFFNELGLSPLARARAGVKGQNAKREESVFLKFMERTDD